MIRKSAQEAYQRYMKALNTVREVAADRPGDFTGDRFTEFYAARVLYNIYCEPLALDAVGNSAFTDDQVLERIRAERTRALRWLLTSRPFGDSMHALTQKIVEDETRHFLSQTAFIDEESELLTGRELLGSLRAVDHYKIVAAGADADAIARESCIVGAGEVAHLFSVALDGGRTVEGTRDRIISPPDGDDGLMAVRVDAEGNVIA